MINNESVLSVNNLKVYFYLNAGRVLKAVDGISFQVDKGKTLGIVGESGSGKSVTARSILQVVDQPGKIVGGEIVFDGVDILTLPDIGQLRGKRISMVFQDPGTALDPLFTVGDQFIETIRVNLKYSKSEARNRAIESMRSVGVPNPEQVLNQYPMDFSAGMIQRIMIGLSISCYPDLILADEPTTTLGVTVQAQILTTLRDIQNKLGMALVLITHDFGVISQIADDIYVMYAGKCMEYGTKEDLLLRPTHPYTIGLINSLPSIEGDPVKRLQAISGFPPDMLNLPLGCPFSPRCNRATDLCITQIPELEEFEENHWIACFHPNSENSKS